MGFEKMLAVFMESENQKIVWFGRDLTALPWAGCSHQLRLSQSSNIRTNSS